ncbi:MAG: DUF4231 domain-containing protein [Solirubrobacterales bacterium]|nr:DUF4231 domain-containing protein [Solirubrobacterales bacterium]
MTDRSLNDSHLPVFFIDTDRASLDAQKLTLSLNRARLLGSIVAAASGAMTWLIGETVDVWGIVALLGFLCALTCEVWILIDDPESRWYSNRALAESTKTLAWRFAVAGNPFPSGLDLKEAKALLLERVGDLAVSTGFSPAASAGKTCADEMVELRLASFEERREAYVEGRLRQQQTWYSSKAEFNRKRARNWRFGLIAFEFVGIVCASGQAFSVWSFDWAGVIAAIVGGGVAWLGLKQHSNLATAYAVASTELSISAEQLSDAPEDEWSELVGDAEEAISREHTLWLASRSASLRLATARPPSRPAA